MTYFVYTITGGLCNYFSCVHFLSIKLSVMKKLTIFLYAFGTLYLFYGSWGQAGTFLTLFGLMFLTYRYTNNSFFNVSCYLFGYLFTVAFNYLCLWVVTLFLHMDIQTFLSHNLRKCLFSIFYCSSCYITTKLLGWLIHKKLNLAKLFINHHLSTAVFINLLLLVLLYIFNFSYGERLGYNYGVIALNGIMFLLLFAVTVCLMYFINKITVKEQSDKHRLAQFENLRNYAEKLEQSYGIMRKFKHDYINILSTMTGYMDNNDMDGLMKYYSEKVLPISHSFTESDTKLGSLSNIKDTGLKSLLSSKFIYAMETGLNVEIELTEPIDNLYIDTLDLARILGIFLDNSIEASVETKEKIVRFCMFYGQNKLWIIVQNTSLPLLYPLGQLNNQEVSSKGENRGLGLYNVDMILKKYKNVTWSTSYQDVYFIQELILAEDCI